MRLNALQYGGGSDEWERTWLQYGEGTDDRQNALQYGGGGTSETERGCSMEKAPMSETERAAVWWGKRRGRQNVAAVWRGQRRLWTSLQQSGRGIAGKTASLSRERAAKQTYSKLKRCRVYPFRSIILPAVVKYSHQWISLAAPQWAGAQYLYKPFCWLAALCRRPPSSATASVRTAPRASRASRERLSRCPSLCLQQTNILLAPGTRLMGRSLRQMGLAPEDNEFIPTVLIQSVIDCSSNCCFREIDSLKEEDSDFESVYICLWNIRGTSASPRRQWGTIRTWLLNLAFLHV